MTVDDAVIQRAVDGDRLAQQTIYEALCDRVHRLVLRVVGESDVDDVTQDVFVHIFRKLGTFRRESEFTTWVHRLAINESLQHLRRVRRRSTIPLEENSMISRAAGNESEIKELFETAFSRIDGELRLLLELKEVERLSYSKIAELIGIPEGTVGSRLNRARRDLREQLTALGWEG